MPHDPRNPTPLPSTGAVSQSLLSSLLGYTTIDSPNYYVDESSVSGLPAIDAAINVIAYSVAQMMNSAHVYDSNDLEIAKPLIIKKPNLLMGTTEVYQQMVRTLLMFGNYIAIVKNDQLIPVHPQGVAIDITRGLPVYTIENHDYAWDEVLHIRRDTPVGTLYGLGVVEKYRLQVEGMLAMQGYGRSSFTNGGVPTGIITLDTEEVTQDQLDNVHEQWVEKTTGGRDVVVLPKSIGFQHLTWSPEDASFVSAVALSVAQAAMMVGLRPSDLEATVGGAGTLTYANLTDRQLSRLVECYAPVMNLIEEGLTDLLPEGQYVQGNPEALLRTSTRERFELIKLQKEIGLLTDDEARLLENRMPMTPQEKADVSNS
jgi:HK97 family phage portal protein